MNIKFLKNYHWVDLPLNIAVLVIYLGLAKLGLAFAITEFGGTLFWPAGGFALAILLLAGTKYIPGVFGGAAVASLVMAGSLSFAVLSALGNTLETICAYSLLTYFRPINRSLDNIQDLFKLLLYGAAISTLISAIIGSVSLVLLGQVEPSLLPSIALRWWMADAIGIAFVTPLILIWHQSRQQLEKKISLELIALFFLTILMGQIVIFHWFIPLSIVAPSIAWVLPFIIWSGLRAGRHYTSLLVLIIFLQALWGASHGLGHYANAMQENGLINFWGFSMLITVGGMLLAIMTAERKRGYEREQKLAHQLPGAIYQYQLFPDGHACFPYASEGIREIYELSPEQVREDASAVFAILHPDDFDRIVTSIQESANSVTLWEIEYRVVLPIKGVRWLYGSARPESLSDGSTLWHGFITDVTEHKQVEMKLQLAHKKYQRLVEEVGSNYFFYRHNLSGVFTYVSNTVTDMLGWTPIEFKTHYSDVMIEHPTNRLCADYTELGLQGKPQSPYLIEVKHKQGGTRWVEVNEAPVYNEKGEIIGLEGIAHDITERKKLEEALAEKQVQHAEAQRIAQIGSWHLNISTNQVTWTEELYRMYGVDPKLPVPPYSEHQKLFTPESWERLRTSLSNTTEKGIPYELELETMKSDGRNGWMRVSGEVVTDKNGETVGLRGTAQDITELKQAELKLANEGRMFRQMFENNTAVKLLIDPEEGSIVNANTAACQFYGYSLKMFNQMKISDINTLPADEIKREMEDAKTEKRHFFRFKHQLSSGEIKDVEVHTGNVNWDDKVYLYSIIIDVSQRNLYEQELEINQNHLKEIIWGTHAGTWEWNIQTGQAIINDLWADIVGYTLDELSPTSIDTFTKLIHPDDVKKSQDLLEKNFSGELEYYEFESRMRHKNGDWVWVLDRGKVVEWTEDGKPLRMSGTHTDITKRKLAEESLRESEQEINLILKTVPDMIWLKDKEGVYLNCNSMFERFFGAERAEIIGKTDYDFVDAELADFFRQHDKEVMEANQAIINEEWLSFADDGHRVLCETTKTPFKDDDGSLIGVLGITHDITERKEAEEKIRHLAMTDPLTGLANRTKFDLCLQQSMKLANREGKSLALMMVDLDKFKPVNDTFGHPAGDALLQAVASIFTQFSRETDVVARLGGDEFAILVVHPNEEESAGKNAQRIIDEINKPMIIMGNKIQIGASIGIALYPKDADKQEGLLKNADLALYKAKESGRGVFTFYHPSMNL